MFGSRWTTLFASLSLLCLRISAQNNYFINPPTPGPDHQYDENNAYGLGSAINLQWKTNFSTISLILWQNDNTSYIYLLDSVPTSQTLRWDVNLNGEFNITSADLVTPNVFFLEIWEMVGNNGDIGGRFSSHYFNITGDQSSTATTLAPSTTISATNTPTSSVTTDATSPATSTASVTSSPSSNGLSDGAKIGIGVGVGVGVPCLLVGAAIAFFFWRKSRRSAGQNQPTPEERKMEEAAPPYFRNSPGGGYTPVDQNNTSYYDLNHMAKSQLSPPIQPSELYGEGQIHELSSMQSQSHELSGAR